MRAAPDIAALVSTAKEDGCKDSADDPADNTAPIYTDNRELYDWKTRYSDARKKINCEAVVLSVYLFITIVFAAAALSTGGQIVEFLPHANIDIVLTIDFRLIAVFFVGCVGGTTFSIKWLIHSVAKGKWHLDRRFWRLFVPFLGGVYACVVLSLFDGGMLGSSPGPGARSFTMTAALAFLVGYFADGVSGLLSNVANAVFGTLERK